MAIDLKEAQRIAEEYINSKYNVAGDRLVTLKELTIEKSYGWYFVTASRRYLETNNFRDMSIGNGPTLVLKESGEIVQFNSAYPLKQHIKLYEKQMSET